MTEWKRHRGSKTMPKCLEGKQYEAMRRDGTIAAFVNSWVHNGLNSDVMRYRILQSEQAADPANPDYSKGFPEGTTAKDIGAKDDDEFLVVKSFGGFKNGEVISLVKDDGTINPWFHSEGRQHVMFWHELAPIQKKPVIEQQEVSKPQPDADGWIEWKGGKCPVEKGTLVDVKYMDDEECLGVMAGMNPHYDGERVRGSHTTRYAADWEYQGGDTAIAAYRLHPPQEWPEDRVDIVGQNGNDGLHSVDETDTSLKHVEKQDENVHIPTISGGGKLSGNHYYRVDVKRPISDELPPYHAECADIIEALDMTFNEGEAFKALWRMAAARQGNGKAGSNQQYDADKVAHYGARVAAHAALKAEALAKGGE